ncbi:uncharacterized protein BDW70DRAFT_89319 [Aspergillus foveolatus]|uniref:uncharacterized protein n=1 Tax=Aspergillus foveolatus TaxID=210207 RepID=UPI003CCCBAC9
MVAVVPSFRASDGGVARNSQRCQKLHWPRADWSAARTGSHWLVVSCCTAATSTSLVHWTAGEAGRHLHFPPGHRVRFHSLPYAA